MNRKTVRPDRVCPLSLQHHRTRPREGQRSHASRVGSVASPDEKAGRAAGARNGLAVHAVDDGDDDGAASLDAARPADLEEVVGVEGIEGPQHLLAGKDLLLAAADVVELEVEQGAPELSGGLGIAADGHDEEIIELVEEGAVPCETAVTSRIAQCRGARRPGCGVGAVVLSIAQVRSARSCSDVLRALQDLY